MRERGGGGCYGRDEREREKDQCYGVGVVREREKEINKVRV